MGPLTRCSYGVVVASVGIDPGRMRHIYLVYAHVIYEEDQEIGLVRSRLHQQRAQQQNGHVGAVLASTRSGVR